MKSKRGLGLIGKQFILFFSVSFVLFFLLTLSTIRETLIRVETQLSRDSNLILTRTNQYLDLYLSHVKNILYLTRQHPELMTTMDLDRSRRVLLDIAEINGDTISNLYLIRQDGRIICSRQVEYEIFGNRAIEVLLQQIQRRSTAISWTEPYVSLLSGRTIAFTFSMGRGYVIVDINLDILSKNIFDFLDGGDRTIILTSAQDETILFDYWGRMVPFAKNVYPMDLTGELKYTLQSASYGENRIQVGEKKQILYKSSENSLDWNVYLLLDPIILSTLKQDILRNSVWLFILLFVLLIIVSYLLTIFITRPIRQLIMKMDTVTHLRAMTPIENKYSDEISHLVDSYNAMITRINEISKEKSTIEFALLQNQIGPHFLNNTLACIASLARQNKIDDVKETIRALVSLLEYTFSRTSIPVTLKEELRIIQDYIYIQTIRFGDCFSFVLDIDEDTGKYRIPALLLQPLIENALLHGIFPRAEAEEEYHGELQLSAAHSSDIFTIEVTDNGIGIDPVVLDLLSKKINESEPEAIVKSKHSHDRFNAIGVINTHKRIRIHYGEPYGLEISRGETDGTTVRIILPANYSLPATQAESGEHAMSHTR